MNPIKTAQTAKNVSKRAGDFVKRNEKPLRITGAIVIGGVVLWQGGKFVLRKLQEAKAGSDPNTDQAIQIKQALNPSGISWLKSLDNTNTTALYKIAKKINNFSKVKKAYARLYNSSLISDLQKELTSSEYEKFVVLIGNKNANSNSSVDDIKQSSSLAGQYVITNTKISVYSSFTKVNVPLAGIEVPAGRVIGVVSRSNGIQTGMFLGVIKTTVVKAYIKTKEGHSRYIYIDKDDVTIEPKESWQKHANSYPLYKFSDKDF